MQGVINKATSISYSPRPHSKDSDIWTILICLLIGIVADSIGD